MILSDTTTGGTKRPLLILGENVGRWTSNTASNRLSCKTILAPGTFSLNGATLHIVSYVFSCSCLYVLHSDGAH
jgi:hypothetical protein